MKSIKNSSKIINESNYFLSENSDIKRKDSRKGSSNLPRSLMNRKSYLKRNSEISEIPLEKFQNDNFSEEKIESNNKNIDENIKQYFVIRS